MNLSADVGEGGEHDGAVLGCVDSASVACGVHAGSASVAIATALKCRNLGVEVGAHPGYDDRPNFGRVELHLSVEEIEALVGFQVAALAAVVRLAFVKPHGALYHRCESDSAAADAVAGVARRHRVGLVGQPGRGILAAAGRAGIPGYREGYADRGMLGDGGLVPRDQPGALLTPELAAAQAVSLARTGRFDSLCVHGDTPGAGSVAAAVRRALRDAMLETGPLVAR